MARPKKLMHAAVGIADHAGYAIAMTVAANGALLDRRRIELIESGLPCMPHHHEGQKLPIDEAVALVSRVRSSAERCARARLDELEAALAHPITSIALRVLPPLPKTVAERIESYKAMCVADWVMYRSALAKAATKRGWSVCWYEEKKVFTDAARALAVDEIDALLAHTRAAVGAPWQKDHKVAMAAAIVAATSSA